MRVKLIKDAILNSLNSEEDLSDMSTMEAIYDIRKLKALVYSMENDGIEVSKPSLSNSVRSKEYEIWFNEGEYEV